MRFFRLFAVGAIAAALGFVLFECTPFESGTTDTSGGGGGSTSSGGGSSADGGADSAAPVCPPGIDVSSDPKNCGVCGRDCGGSSACSSGQCTPQLIADTPGGHAWYIAVDESHVYWTSLSETLDPVGPGDGHVRRVPKLGGAVTEVSTFAKSFDLVVVKDDLYFTTNQQLNGVRKMAKTAVGVADPPIAYNARATDIVARGGRVFFTGAGVRELANPIRVLGQNKSATGKNEEGLTVDGDNVYWILHEGPLLGTISRVSLTAASPDAGTVLVSEARGARRMTSDNDAIYWVSESSNGGVWRLPKAGGSPVQLSTNTIRYGTVIVDGDYLYVTAEMEGSIWRFNKLNGSDAVAVATNLQLPVGLAQDDLALYFTERRSGKVWRLRK